MKQCTHLNQIYNVTPNTNGCEECLKMGDTLLPGSPNRRAPH
jgi:hypothetical protein